jgi:uncharacterized membrane protein
MAPALSSKPTDSAVLALVAAAFAALLALAGPAAAQQQQRPSGWQLCNETSFVLEAATGRPDGRSILVQGWTRLRPGECQVAVSAPLARGTHYLYARTSNAHRGGRRQWGGDAVLCADASEQFQIVNPPQCGDSYEPRRFRRVQINKRDSWRTTFSEATPFTLARARQVGIQRLLNDAGYEVQEGRRGADPRMIAQAIAQFRVIARLPADASDDQIIDALEAQARRRAAQVGLTLCNRARARVWTAIGRRRGEGWESRGWWPINPGGCVRTIDDVLTQDRYYVYASLESDQGPRYLSAGEPFCTSPSRFAILGRSNCQARFYHTQAFAPINARGREGLVVEFEERDFLDPGVAPRLIEPSGDVDGGAPRRSNAPSSGAPTTDRTTRATP